MFTFRSTTADLFAPPIEDRIVNRDDYKHLECGLCLGLLKEPKQCLNGNMFCGSCIDDAIRKGTRTCPICRVAISSHNVSRSLIADRIISTLKVYCINHYPYDFVSKKWSENNDREIACQEIMAIGDIDNHKKECRYTYIKCKYDGCYQQHFKVTLDEHQEKCEHRLEECELCKGSFKVIDDHGNTTCPEKEIKCHQCDTTHKRKDKQKHLDDDCPNQNIPCPFEKEICSFECQRKDMKLHIEECLHDHILLFKKNSQDDSFTTFEWEVDLNFPHHFTTKLSHSGVGHLKPSPVSICYSTKFSFSGYMCCLSFNMTDSSVGICFHRNENPNFDLKYTLVLTDTSTGGKQFRKNTANTIKVPTTHQDIIGSTPKVDSITIEFKGKIKRIKSNITNPNAPF